MRTATFIVIAVLLGALIAVLVRGQEQYRQIMRDHEDAEAKLREGK